MLNSFRAKTLCFSGHLALYLSRILNKIRIFDPNQIPHTTRKVLCIMLALMLLAPVAVEAAKPKRGKRAKVEQSETLSEKRKAEIEKYLEEYYDEAVLADAKGDTALVEKLDSQFTEWVMSLSEVELDYLNEYNGKLMAYYASINERESLGRDGVRQMMNMFLEQLYTAQQSGDQAAFERAQQSYTEWVQSLSLDDADHFKEYVNEITAAQYQGEVSEDRAEELREVVAKFYGEIGLHAARGEQEAVVAKQKEYSDWFMTLPNNEKGFAMREMQRLQERDAQALRELTDGE